MGHLGLTPQSVNQFGGFKVQGRADDAAPASWPTLALQEAGAFALVLEACPPTSPPRSPPRSTSPPSASAPAPTPTARCWSGTTCSASPTGRLPRFVKQYVDLRSQITDAVKAYATEVADGAYPAEEHTY